MDINELLKGKSYLTNFAPPVQKGLPTGLSKLDEALSIGGFPQGALIEIIGEELTGKSTLSWHGLLAGQKEEGSLLIDSDHAFNARYAQAIGVNLNDLLLCEPDTFETAREIALSTVEHVSVLVIDSLSMLVSESEINGSLQDNYAKLNVDMIKTFLSELNRKARQNGTTVFLTHPLRKQRSKVHKLLHYYADVTIELQKGKNLFKGHRLNGNKIHVSITKNAYGSTGECELDLIYGQGLSQKE